MLLVHCWQDQPAKLANFAEIDIFVLISCPENALIDSKELYEPVITPSELEHALLQDRQWTGTYSADYADLLPGSTLHDGGVSNIEVRPNENENENDTYISLIDGKVHAVHGSSTIDSATTGNELTVSDTRIVANNAAEYMLMKRNFTGLLPQYGETPAAKAVTGKAGIAWSYDKESPSRKSIKRDSKSYRDGGKQETMEEEEEQQQQQQEQQGQQGREDEEKEMEDEKTDVEEDEEKDDVTQHITPSSLAYRQIQIQIQIQIQMHTRKYNKTKQVEMDDNYLFPSSFSPFCPRPFPFSLRATSKALSEPSITLVKLLLHLAITKRASVHA